MEKLRNIYKTLFDSSTHNDAEVDSERTTTSSFSSHSSELYSVNPASTSSAGHLSQYSDSGSLKDMNLKPTFKQNCWRQIGSSQFSQQFQVAHNDRATNLRSVTEIRSGKTVIFELAIIRLLMRVDEHPEIMGNFKIVYMAPIKALCSERYQDWQEKFGSLGYQCLEVTGDSEAEDYFEIQKVSIILTTPEKWDSMTRHWRDKSSLVKMVRLLLVDEIHLLNDETRGATTEAVLSRMKTVQRTICREYNNTISSAAGLRFIAASATVPNPEDIAEWLGSSDAPALSFKMGEELRSVKLWRLVLGYPCPEEWSEFKFDLNLSYKLASVIQRHSEHKPTLVFCSTRKSVIQTSTTLAKESKFVYSPEHKQKLVKIANTARDNKLRDEFHYLTEILLYGIGFHHAGLAASDRKMIEIAFLAGDIPVLISTSTLAMGVNLPAHLVIIKSTTQYLSGSCKEYSETQILQMIGRAGRPQFDTTATAIIMTKSKMKDKYQALIDCKQAIESSLHKNLIEHLNAEIVLQTITDVTVAIEWLQSTFLYIRMLKNPTHYGIQTGLTKEQMINKLQEMCLKELNALSKYNLIYMDDNCFDLRPKEGAFLMAKHCVAFNTMKTFTQLGGNETLEGLLILICGCQEFDDIPLRTNEKKILNSLNMDKKLSKIRFPISGKITTRVMKINCLIQATFGCVPIQEPSLNQELSRILRIAERACKCLTEYVSQRPKGFQTLLNATILAKCFRAKLWENSKYVSRQIEKIGIQLSTSLVNAGITSFSKLLETNARQLEMIVSRNPPFGTHLQKVVSELPRYKISIEQNPKRSDTEIQLNVSLELENLQVLCNLEKCTSSRSCVMLIGDADNHVVLHQRIRENVLIEKGVWRRNVWVKRATRGDDLYVHIVNEQFVGLDLHQVYQPVYMNSTNMMPQKRTLDIQEETHDVLAKTPKRAGNSQNKQAKNTGVKSKSNSDRQVRKKKPEWIKNSERRAEFFQGISNVQRLRPKDDSHVKELGTPTSRMDDFLKRFSYKRPSMTSQIHPTQMAVYIPMPEQSAMSEPNFDIEFDFSDDTENFQQPWRNSQQESVSGLQICERKPVFQTGAKALKAQDRKKHLITMPNYTENNVASSGDTSEVCEFTIEDFQDCINLSESPNKDMSEGTTMEKTKAEPDKVPSPEQDRWKPPITLEQAEEMFYSIFGEL